MNETGSFVAASYFLVLHDEELGDKSSSSQLGLVVLGRGQGHG